MEILHLKDLGDTSVVSECSLGDNCCYVASDSPPQYKILKQSDHYLWRYCILKILGIQVSSANAVWVLIKVDNLVMTRLMMFQATFVNSLVLLAQRSRWAFNRTQFPPPYVF